MANKYIFDKNKSELLNEIKGYKKTKLWRIVEGIICKETIFFQFVSGKRSDAF